ncbi:MAG TPA: tRNA (guanine(46)-N(7))-methyltransferase TrmB [Alphaproteobacteria bacterium]|nr:tRNA (guanine(46)-N(7))-methyltransferase TrmB [Alphaproteobacteria bacterium]
MGRAGPPAGRVYGRRRGRRLGSKKAELLGSDFRKLSILLPDPPERLDPLSLFDPHIRSVCLEIGFGGGEHLAAQAAAHPDMGYIGCEPFLNGVSNLLALLKEGEQRNVRIFSDDARLLLQVLSEASLAGAFLLFPDPWPKRRHERRRFLGQALDLLAKSLTDDAEFRIATDHPALGTWMEEVMAASPDFMLVDRAASRPEAWQPTRYEAKALAAGRRPVYLSYRRVRRPTT